MIASHLILKTVAVALVGCTSVAALPAETAAAPEQDLQRRFTATGSTDNTNTCTSLELVWFRSGYEPQGPSLGLMGDPLYNEILKQTAGLGITVSARNTVYDTNINEELFTPIVGGQDATKWLNKRSKQCPDQRYFVAGYSKGTLPLHLTYPANPGRKRVVASLVVGDFMNKKSYVAPLLFNSSWPSNGPDSIKSLCNFDDAVCYPHGKNHEIHLHPAYLGQLPAAVTWMLGLYKRNLQEPFRYVYTDANH